MRQSRFFKTLCTLVLWFYGAAAAQAGQVITAQERDWAKQALSQEARVGDIASSKSIAVLNFSNLTTRRELDPLQKGLALMLITDLSKVSDIVVVERIRMQALVDEMDLGASGLVDPETAPEAGKLLKAYYVANGTIEKGTTEELALGPALLDVPFATVTDLPPAPGSLEEISRMEKDVLFSIIDQLNIYLTPAQKQELEEPLSVSSAALLALFMGIDASDKGNYAEAARLYDKALSEDPNLQLARDTMQELKDMGLVESEDISRTDETPAEEAAVESGGSGAGTAIVVGLGLAAIAGGAAALASSSSSDDDSTDQPREQVEVTDTTTKPETTVDQTTPPPQPSDTEAPFITVIKDIIYNFSGGYYEIDYTGDSFRVVFNEPMNQSVDPQSNISISNVSGSTPSLTASWFSDYTIWVDVAPLSSGDSFTLTFANFTDLAGNAMNPESSDFEVQ